MKWVDGVNLTIPQVAFPSNFDVCE